MPNLKEQIEKVLFDMADMPSDTDREDAAASIHRIVETEVMKAVPKEELRLHVFSRLHSLFAVEKEVC